MRRQVTRTGKLLGCYVPKGIVAAIEVWVGAGDERSISNFIRDAAREKLSRENIPYRELETAIK